MCVNLKTFNESFRKWAEEQDEQPDWSTDLVVPDSEGTSLLLANLDREKLIAQEESSEDTDK